MAETPTETESADPWGKLRRRKVVQWGIAYAAGAWGLLQVLEYVTDTFHWPERIQQGATIVLLVGLPIALVIAWYHGDRGQQRVSRSELAILAAILALGGGVFAWFGRPTDAADAVGSAQSTVAASSTAAAANVAGSPSIAVLPFANMSEDPANAYFADGISEEMLNLLGKISQLHVAARTSSFSFKGKDVDIATIARQLGVRHVLEGSVRKSGNRVRINAQLIKADDGFRVWSETYDRTLDDVFAVQDEIAAAVVASLKVTLLASATPNTVRTDPQAYALYLQAKQVGAEGSAASRVRAIGLLRQSLDVAPDYAPAWHALAGIYATQTWQSEIPLQSGFASMRAAIDSSIAADPEYGPAYASKALYLFAHERNFVEARQQLKMALKLAPADPAVLVNAGTFLMFTGRVEQALAVRRTLLERDPLNPSRYSGLGNALTHAGRFKDARVAYLRWVELQPEVSSVHSALAVNDYLLGNFAAALIEADKETNEPLRLSARALALHGLGRTAESRATSDKLAAEFPDWGLDSAQGYAARGEIDAAFAALERGLREDDPAIVQLRVEQLLKPLHADPRWPKLLEKVGLSDAVVADLTLDVKL